MKRRAVLILLLVMFAVSVLLAAVEGFRNCSAEDGLVLERAGVFQGHLAPLFATSFVWSKYPAVPNAPTALVSEKAFVLTIPLLLVALYFARVRGRRPFPLRIAVCLAVALVPYAAGVIALHNNTVAEKAGAWLAVMILGPLYALLACAVICVVELLRPRPRARSPWERVPLECPSITAAAPHQ